MKKLIIILGFIAALIAVILSVTPLFKLSVIPLIIAFACGLGVFFLSKKDKTKPKAIQYIFLLTIIALFITIYKAVFTTSEVVNTEEIQKRDDASEEDAIELLEGIEIDE